MKSIHIILITAVLMLAACPAFGQESAKYDKRDFKLSWNVDRLKVYQQEPAVLTLYLWTPEMEVTGATESKAPELSRGSFATKQKADIAERASVVEKDGRRWYVYPVDSYAVTMADAGKHLLRNGRYLVDVSVPTIYDDPFWGRVQTVRGERIEVPVDPLTIEVQPLPDIKGGDMFSGSVGAFSVDVSVPPGDIYLNEDAIAIITVRGPGYMGENVLPEYNEAFTEGTRLKSFSENRNQYIDKGRLVSEVKLECTFIPTSRENAVIGPVRFMFFNPETGKYQKVESEKVKVKVKSIAGKSKVHEI